MDSMNTSPESSLPSYGSRSSGPPSFQSSPPRSIGDADEIKVSDAPDLITYLKSYVKVPMKAKIESEPKSQLLKSISEVSHLKEKPSALPTEAGPNTPRRSRRWALAAILVILLLVGLLAGLVGGRKQHAGSGVSTHTVIAATVTSTTVVSSATTLKSTDTSTRIIVSTSTKVYSSTEVVSSTKILKSTEISTRIIVGPSSSSSAATPTPTSYDLGGFDTVTINSVAHMFYTNRNGSITHLTQDSTYWYSWDTSYQASQIAQNVKPGSPVSASVTKVWYTTGYSTYFNEAHVFYVDTNNILQGVAISNNNGNFYDNLIGNLKLYVSDNMFIRTCVPDRSDYYYGNNYRYGSNADLYLYYTSRDGNVLKKYGLWRSPGQSASAVANNTWTQLYDFPLAASMLGGAEITCELMGGFETIWMINTTTQEIDQWWRPSGNATDWVPGITIASPLHPKSSLYSVTTNTKSPYSTHLLFQTHNQNHLMRYDITGQGNATVLNSYDTFTSSATDILNITANTRVTAFALSDYMCLFYQEAETSLLHFQTFTESCTLDDVADHPDDDFNDETNCVVSSYGYEDGAVLLVETYGRLVKPPAHIYDENGGGKRKLTYSTLSLLVVGLCVSLFTPLIKHSLLTY